MTGLTAGSRERSRHCGTRLHEKVKIKFLKTSPRLAMMANSSLTHISQQKRQQMPFAT